MSSSVVQEVQKKPVSVEAIQFDGTRECVNTIFQWVNESGSLETPAHIEHAKSSKENYLTIYTLEGPMRAEIGWWIIKGVKGEFYPCDPEVFQETYYILGDK